MGGFYGSIIFPRPREHAGLLPLTVGARLASTLQERFGIPLAVKWPNDLLVVEPGRPARKLAGILIDDVPSPQLGRAVVVGLGVNVRLPATVLPSELEGQVAAIDEFASGPLSLEEVEEMAVAAATGAVERLSHPDGVREARALCRGLLYGVGRPVTVDGHPAGSLAALGDEGELWLATGTNRVAIWAGDVRVEGFP